MPIHAGTRILYGDCRRERHRSARGWMSSQNAGIVDATTHAIQPPVLTSVSMSRF
jgi:hypothetical protein